MGAVSSRPEAPEGITVYDDSRFSISEILISDADSRPLARVLPLKPNDYHYIIVRNESAPMIEFVQDITTTSLSTVLLKLHATRGLMFTFSVVLNKSELENFDIAGLTFMAASNGRQLDTMLTKELQFDPNIQNRSNVKFIGDYSSSKSSKVLEWSWTWQPPHDFVDQFNGWRNSCCFAEYQRRNHKLTKLAEFAFWVQASPHPKTPRIVSGLSHSPRQVHISQFADSDVVTNLEHSPNAMFSNTLSVGDVQTSDNPSADSSLTPVKSESSTISTATTVNEKLQHDTVIGPASDSSYPDDGPLFRATIASLEKKTTTLKSAVKRLLKQSTQAYEAQMNYYQNYAMLISAFRETAKNLKTMQPIADVFCSSVGPEILQFERKSCSDLHSQVIDILRRLYDYEIKAADNKKRDFEDEEREYYSWLNRYLSIKNEPKGRKKSESDSKYQDKRKTFELRRFDYYSYIQDLHGGRKEQEASYHLSAYVESVVNGLLAVNRNLLSAKPQFENMLMSVRAGKEQLSLKRTEREELRRALERSAMPDPSMSASVGNGQSVSSGSGYLKNPGSASHFSAAHSASHRRVSQDVGNHPREKLAPLAISASGSGSNRVVSVNSGSSTTDGDDTSASSDDTGRRKEGLLWAMSRPGGHNDPRNLNKPGWHKFWVVLAGGQLCEYTNWKQSLELHNDPINLQMASAREARGTDRRFCFEVITPQYRRVYQATSEEDMHSWIRVISNAISNTIEGSSPSLVNLNVMLSDTNLTAGLHSPAGSRKVSSSSAAIGSILTSSRRRDGGTAVHDNSEELDSSDIPGASDSLLKRLRETDAANGTCADCAGNSKVEWVSINLMVVLCIECGGIHRSLGSHISKVRSLTLDTVSFTSDLVDGLIAVGNTRANMIWEADRTAAETKKLLRHYLNNLKSSASAGSTTSGSASLQSASPHPGGGSTADSGGEQGRQARLSFIMAKYVRRVFVERLTAGTDLKEMLRCAAQTNDVVQTLRVLALGANAYTIDEDSSDSSKDDRKACPIAIVALTNAGMNVSTFPVAEMLVQHGAKIPREIPADVSLSSSARAYILRKQAQQNEGRA
ncbi:uncharacterized protein V1516DRAFT_643472 [Lipomyces oligophaga]|uniref:uncharacterized protein n=1 Tax=Lipomyces oligophaga TaxID=45792 RepID=UPI0034CD57EA